MEKRIKTTMIGSIDAFYKKFKKEIESDKDFRKRFFEVREKILDLGNLQILLYKKDKEKEEE